MKHSSLFSLFLVFMLLSCSEQQNLTTSSQSALKLYQQGVRYYDDFYYAEAKASFDSALVFDSTFAMAWGRLASLNFDTKDEQAARKNIVMALSYSQKVTRREQLYIRFWDRRIQFDDLGAAKVADSLLGLYPREAEAYVMRGLLYETRKNLDSAIVLYNQASRLDTGYAKAIMLLGYAYSTTGDHERAISHMERYIRLAPDVADPRASYADLLLRVGRYDDALEQYRKSLELKSDYWYALNQIGLIYTILGKLKDAETQFDRGLALLPQSSQIEATRVTVRASLDLQRGKNKEAAERFQLATAMDSTSLDASYGLAWALARLGKFEDADRMTMRIKDELERRNLTESQAMVGFHLMRARVLTEQHRWEEGKTACDDALEFSTPISRGPVFRQLAEIFLKTGEYESAISSCEEALLINRNSPQALLTLVKVYEAEGDHRMTLEIGNRLLGLWKDADPDFQDLVQLKQILAKVHIS